MVHPIHFGAQKPSIKTNNDPLTSHRSAEKVLIKKYIVTNIQNLLTFHLCATIQFSFMIQDPEAANKSANLLLYGMCTCPEYRL